MRNKTDSKLGRLLGKSKWIALLGVLVLYSSSGLLVLMGILKLYYIIDMVIGQLMSIEKIDTIYISASFLIIIEIYLMAIIFYIFAVGLYKLFVGEITLLYWYKIDSLDEMKAELAKTIVILLSVFIVQKIIEWKDPIHLLLIAVATTLTCASLIWYTKSLRINNNNNNNNNNSNNHKNPPQGKS